MKHTLITLMLLQAGWLHANPDWNYERLISLFSPGDSEYLLSPFTSELWSRNCHTVTGCTEWSGESGAPDLVFENSSLWRCSRCTSTRFSSAPDAARPFPLEQISPKLYFYGNKLHFGFFAPGEPYKLRFESAYNQETESFTSTGISTSSYYSYHEPTLCSPVGRDRECKVGNHYSGGRAESGRATFRKASRIVLADSEFRAEFEAASRPDSHGLYQEYRWYLKLPAP